MTQRGNDVSNICRFVPKLTVNGQFMRDFMAEESPCFALGLVEERKQPCGFLALRFWNPALGNQLWWSAFATPFLIHLARTARPAGGHLDKSERQYDERSV